MSEPHNVTILFLADVIGKPGLTIMTALLPALKKKYNVDLTIVNGENGAQGKGLTEQIALKFFSAGADIITGGNHSWNIASFRQYLNKTDRVLRPLNYPNNAPGRGAVVTKTKSGVSVGVINLQGRTFMYPIDCPFKCGIEQAEELRQKTNIIFIDFHAEASAEKLSLGWYLDGTVSAVIGTHTHVQTADERILPNGTAYITDAGMTGPMDSVIGMDVNTAIKRFTTQLPERYRIASSNNRLNGVLVTVSTDTGKATNITRMNLP